MSHQLTFTMERASRILSHLNPTPGNILASHVSATSPPPKLITRRLESGDFHKGFLELLAQLSVVGALSRDQFDARLAEIDANAKRHSVMVIEDTSRGRIIACATLYLEPKFLRDCGTIGHIEDVVVAAGYRGQHLGVKIVETLKSIAKDRGCYKVILNCSDKNTSFYSKLGFVRKENQMAVYF